MHRILVFCPFRANFDPVGGSPIRIKGYVSNFIKENVDFLFMSKEKPEYINENIFVPFRLKNYYRKLFLIHNVFYAYRISRPIAHLLKIILFLNSEIKKLKSVFSENLVITHQENSICYFFFLQYKIDFIYDIHGILHIQNEYINTMNHYRKFWFFIQLKNESLLFRDIPYVNCINEQMISYLVNEMKFRGKAFIAPDGFLNIDSIFKSSDIEITEELSKKYSKPGRKIILFFGEFKAFGGVQFLCRTFSKMAIENNSIYLILIGTGQMENIVKQVLSQDHVKERFTHIPKVPNHYLKAYMELSDLIVIPDMDNLYNKMIPHIKLFDSIIAGKPVIVPAFKVNRNILNRIPNNAVYFLPDNDFDLKEKINIGLSKDNIKYKSSDREKFLDWSYETFTRNLIEQYISFF